MSNTEELQHIVSRLDEASRLTVESAKNLAIEVELARELAAQDRVQVARLIVLMHRLTEAIERLEQTSHHVAKDLAASILRADEAPTDIPGAGADAALRSEHTAAEMAASEKGV